MDHNRAAILAVVFRAIERTNEVLSSDDVLEKREDTAILGEGAGLDSMGFINFVVALEDELEAAAGFSCNLVEELNSVSDGSRSLNAGDLATFLTAMIGRRTMGSERVDAARDQ